MSADFEWFKDPAVAVRHQPAIAVYRNSVGDITIRQRGEVDPETYEENDTIVTVTGRNAAALARAILALAEPQASPPLALPAPADKTAANRQRRYRVRKRDGVTVPERDDRNAVTPDAVTDRDDCNGDGVTDRNAGSVTGRDGDAGRPSRYWPPKDLAGG